MIELTPAEVDLIGDLPTVNGQPPLGMLIFALFQVGDQFCHPVSYIQPILTRTTDLE